MSKILRETALQVQHSQDFVGKPKPRICVGDTISKLMYLTIAREILSLGLSQMKLQLHGYDWLRVCKNLKKSCKRALQIRDSYVMRILEIELSRAVREIDVICQSGAGWRN